MMHTLQGVVLRIDTRMPNRVTVLERTYGRIDTTVSGHMLTPGALIEWWVTSDDMTGGAVRTIYKSRLLNLPLPPQCTDLLLLHHILEVCYYSIPVGIAVYDVFKVVQFLYTEQFSTLTATDKKIYLLKLFMAIGLIPDINPADNLNIMRLYAGVVDSDLYPEIDLATEHLVDTWLLACIMQHPRYEKFNTAALLINNICCKPNEQKDK